jgi:hypothetical protein
MEFAALSSAAMLHRCKHASLHLSGTDHSVLLLLQFNPTYR